MKLPFIRLLLTAGIVAGCGHTKTVEIDDHSDQWVLENYDSGKGYTFIRGGVQYQTHCLSAGIEKNGVVPPMHSTKESDCSIVLSYLHQPIPLEKGAPELHHNDILVFKEPSPDPAKGVDNWRCIFLITEAR